MPVFEYRCTGCREVYEILHLGREKAEEIVCPSCGSRERTKLFSAVAVQTGHAPAERGCASGGECCGGGCATDGDSWK